MDALIERLEAQYKEMQIPFELCSEWGGKITCDRSCSRCNGSIPRCKTNVPERARCEIRRMIMEYELKYPLDYKRNICVLHFFFLVGQNHFRNYVSKLQWMTKTQKEFVDFRFRSARMEDMTNEIVNVHFCLPQLVKRIFPSLTLSRDQYKFMCKWMQDDFPVVPRCIWKKMLMTSVALGFLTKRLVGHLKFLEVTMFHAVFKQTIVRKKDKVVLGRFPFKDEDLLNVFFPKRPALSLRSW